MKNKVIWSILFVSALALVLFRIACSSNHASEGEAGQILRAREGAEEIRLPEQARISPEIERAPLIDGVGPSGAEESASIVLRDFETGQELTSGVVVSSNHEIHLFDLAGGAHVSRLEVPRIFAVFSDGYIPIIADASASNEYLLRRDPGIVVETTLDREEWIFSKSLNLEENPRKPLELELFRILRPHLKSTWTSEGVWLQGWPFWCPTQINANHVAGKTIIPLAAPACIGDKIYMRRTSMAPQFSDKSIELVNASEKPMPGIHAAIIGLGRGKAITNTTSDEKGILHFPFDTNSLGDKVVRIQAKSPENWTFYERVRFAENDSEARVAVGRAQFAIEFGSNDVSNFEFAIAAAWIPDNRKALFGAQPSINELAWKTPSDKEQVLGGMSISGGWYGEDSCLIVRAKESGAILAAFEITDGEVLRIPEIATGTVALLAEGLSGHPWEYLIEMIGSSQSLQASSGSDLVNAKGKATVDRVELPLPPGEYALTLFDRSVPYAGNIQFRVVQGELTEVPFQLQVMNRTNVAVLTLSGKPVPGAVVYFYENVDDEEWRYGFSGQCDEDGIYRGLIPNELRFCRAGSRSFSAWSYSGKPTLSHWVSVPEEGDVRVRMEVGWLNITGLPVADRYLGRNNSASLMLKEKGTKFYYRVPMELLSNVVFREL